VRFPLTIGAFHSLRRRGNGDSGLALRLVSLSCENLVVVGAKGHVSSSPSVEEETSVDGSAGAVVVSDGPVLLESLDAVNAKQGKY
jgi:hypothetical protein